MLTGEPACCERITQLQQLAHWCGARPRGKTETHFREEGKKQLFVPPGA